MTEHVQGANWHGAVKAETTQNTDAFGGLAPTEWAKLRKLEIVQVIEMRRETSGTATDAAECAQPVKMQCKVDWEVGLFACNDAITEHVIGDILRSCKLKQTIDAGNDITYSPYSGNDMTNTPTCTWVKYELNSSRQAKRLTGRGVRSVPEIVLEMGQPAYIKGTGEGVYTEEPDAFSAAPALPTQYSDDLKALVVTNLALTSDSGAVAWKVNKASIKSAQTISKDMSGDPIGGGVVSDVMLHSGGDAGSWTMDFTLEKGAAAIADLIARMKSGAVIDFEITLSAGGRSFTTSIPAGQIRQYTKSSDATKKYQASLDMTRPNGTAGDNEMAMVFA